MLMAEITESFEALLARTVRRLIPRLLVINGELRPEDHEDDMPAEDDVYDLASDGHLVALAAQLRMAVRLRNAVDNHIRFMVVTGATNMEESLLDDALGGPLPPRLTWKEIGEALGVSAQAAHRKYGEAARMRRVSRELPRNY
jgi:hypothetical protein